MVWKVLVRLARQFHHALPFRPILWPAVEEDQTIGVILPGLNKVKRTLAEREMLVGEYFVWIRDAHSKRAKTVTLEKKTVDPGPILTAFGGSMARKEAERNTRYG